jgi:hypothetical protein
MPTHNRLRPDDGYGVKNAREALRPLHDYLALNAWQLKNIKAGIAAAERWRFCQLLGILCLPSLSIDPGWEALASG